MNRSSTTRSCGHHHLVTPDGHAYLALGINHIEMLQQSVGSGLSVRGDAAWEKFWSQTLRPQFADWNLTTLGYLRCQYIDRPAGFGRGLRQGILQTDGTPRDALVRVYRDGFAAALENLKNLAP